MGLTGLPSAMRFDLPGLTLGPTDSDLEHLARHQLRLEDAQQQSEEEQARALGLTLEQWRTLQASLRDLRR